MDAGLGLELPEGAALLFGLFLEGRELRIERLRVDGSSVLSRSPDRETFLVLIPEDHLRAFAPSVDLDRLDEARLRTAPEAAGECALEGMLSEPDGAESPRLDVWAQSVGTLYAVPGAGDHDALEPRSEWPAPLAELAVQVPLASPCAPFSGSTSAFAAGPRLLEVGERIGLSVLTAENPQVTNLSRVAYLGEDLALVMSARALHVVRRGARFSAAPYLDGQSAEFPPPPDPSGGWFFIDFSLDPEERFPRAGHLLAEALRGGEAPGLQGLAVFRFTVTSTSIGRPHLRHYEPVPDELSSTELARRIAHRPDGGFGAVGRGHIFTASGDGPTVVHTLREIDATHLLYLPPPFAPAMIQGRGRTWWFGRLEAPLELRSESAGPTLSSSPGVTRLVSGPGEPYLVSHNSLPELWRRFGPDDWRLHRWWLAHETSGCAANIRRCGRLQPVAYEGGRDMAVSRTGAVFTAFDGCDAILRTRAGENRCSEYLPIRWSDYMVAERPPRLASMDTRGARTLIGGNSGLLVELSEP